MSDPMTRTGPRDELIRVLRDIADGCLAADDLAAAARDGAARLASGDHSVRVGHTRYVVTDG